MAHAICPWTHTTRLSLWLLQKLGNELGLHVLAEAVPEDVVASDDIDEFQEHADAALLSSDLADGDLLKLLEYLCAYLCLDKTTCKAHLMGAASLGVDDRYLLQFHYQCAMGLVLRKLRRKDKLASHTFKYVLWQPCPEKERVTDLYLLEDAPAPVGVLHALYCGFVSLASHPAPLLAHAAATVVEQLPVTWKPYASLMIGIHPKNPLDALAEFKHWYLKEQHVSQPAPALLVTGFEVLFTVYCLYPFIVARDARLGQDADKTRAWRGDDKDFSFDDLMLPRCNGMAMAFGHGADSAEAAVLGCRHSAVHAPVQLLLRLCYIWRHKLCAPALLGTSVGEVAGEARDIKLDEALLDSNCNEAQLQLGLFATATIQGLRSLPANTPIPAEVLSTYLRLISAAVMPSGKHLSLLAYKLVRALERLKVIVDAKAWEADSFAHRLALAALIHDCYNDQKASATALHYTEFLHVFVLTVQLRRHPASFFDCGDIATGLMERLRAVFYNNNPDAGSKMPAFCPPLWRRFATDCNENTTEHWLDGILGAWDCTPCVVGALDEAVQYSLSFIGLNTQRQKKVTLCACLSGRLTAAPLALSTTPNEGKHALRDCHTASAVDMSLRLCKLAAQRARVCWRRVLQDTSFALLDSLRELSEFPPEAKQSRLLDHLGPGWVIRRADWTHVAHYGTRSVCLAVKSAHAEGYHLYPNAGDDSNHREADYWLAARALLASELRRLTRSLPMVVDADEDHQWRKLACGTVPVDWADVFVAKRDSVFFTHPLYSAFPLRAAPQQTYLHTFAAPSLSALQKATTGQMNPGACLMRLAVTIYTKCLALSCEGKDLKTEEREFWAQHCPIAANASHQLQITDADGDNKEQRVKWRNYIKAKGQEHWDTLRRFHAMSAVVLLPNDAAPNCAWDSRAFFAAFGCQGEAVTENKDMHKKRLRKVISTPHHLDDVEARAMLSVYHARPCTAKGWYEQASKVYGTSQRQYANLYSVRCLSEWFLVSCDDNGDHAVAFELLIAPAEFNVGDTGTTLDYRGVMSLEKLPNTVAMTHQVLRHMAEQIARTTDLRMVGEGADHENTPMFTFRCLPPDASQSERPRFHARWGRPDSPTLELGYDKTHKYIYYRVPGHPVLPLVLVALPVTRLL